MSEERETSAKHRDLIFRLNVQYGIIEVKSGTKKWRIAPLFLKILNSNWAQSRDSVGVVINAVKAYCQQASTDEKSVIAAFIIDWATKTNPNFKIDITTLPADIKKGKETLDYLLEEEKHR